MPDINLNKVSLNKEVITLFFKHRDQRKLLISEIDKVYVKVYKAPQAYTVLLLVPILILVYDFYFTILVSLITIAIILIKRHKTYEFKMSLKNGESFKKHYKKESKQEYIEITQRIRKEIFLYKIAQNI
jgi:hypothetical protein